MEEKLKISFCLNAAGKNKVLDFLKDLRSSGNKSDQKAVDKILDRFNLLSQKGTIEGSDLIDKLGKDLWEMRQDHVRVIFAYLKPNQICILHGFVKKTKKTPKAALKIARNNLKKLSI